MDLDPKYSDATSYLSYTYISELQLFWSTDRYLSIQHEEELALKAVTLDSNNFLGYWALSDLYMITGKNDKALDAIKKAIELQPGEGRILVDYAVILRKVGRPEESILIFEKALRLNPHIDDSYACFSDTWKTDIIMYRYLGDSWFFDYLINWEKERDYI